MSQMEQYPAGIDMEAERVHIPRTRTLVQRTHTISYSEQRLPSDITRHGNYEATLRIACGSYASLRKAGYAQHDAIAVLYAHGAVFRDFTKASTDAYAFRPPDGMRRPPKMSTYLLNYMRSLLTCSMSALQKSVCCSQEVMYT